MARRQRPKAPTSSRHGKIAEGNKRRQFLASAEQFATYDAAAERAGLSFNAWARQALDVAARVRVR
jgi:hypothetical protein